MGGTAPGGQKYQTVERSEKSAEGIKTGEEINNPPYTLHI